ncbi:PTS sugar transporter subunit IID [Neisseria sp. HMSC067G12]|uniref:PTS sugar transporter subunit IID n=1 Tax=Neisseria sp. HMSC067G12 TaxID=1739375 RepID=UPI0024B215DE|nr:PTS sugar transporter subunit IID [Neisseria sp. HMSC067G12]
MLWALLLALVVRTCNQPAHADTDQLEQETPAIWETDPTAGIVLEPVSEEAEQ